MTQVTMQASSDRERQMQAISLRLSNVNPLIMLSTEDHATLRRMYLTNQAALTGVTVKLLLQSDVPATLFESDWNAWKLLVHVAALLSGTARAPSHAHWRGFGSALRESQPSLEASDKRLLRLTTAKGQALRDQVSLAVRVIARAGKGPINLSNILDLAGHDLDRAERARIRIAKDYYSFAARAKGNAK